MQSKVRQLKIRILYNFLIIRQDYFLGLKSFISRKGLQIILKML
jgi:hypothetical protein